MEANEPLDRGVYRAPWKGTKGETILVAVDSHGTRIMELVVFPGVDPEPIHDLLWQVLDAEDPLTVYPRLVA